MDIKKAWTVKKVQEKKLDVAEMRMLRWISGVTKLDRIRNEIIRGTPNVGVIYKKVQEIRLKWYGHVLRREEEYVGKRVMVVVCMPGRTLTYSAMLKDRDYDVTPYIIAHIDSKCAGGGR